MTLRMICALLLCIGASCAGELDDPERHRAARATAEADAGDTAAATDAASSDTAVTDNDAAEDANAADTAPPPDAPTVEEVTCDPIGVSAQERMATRCATDFCHSAETSLASLNLDPPDIAARVYGVPSTTCSGRLIIDPERPEESFLLNILSESPDCDRPRMPIAGTPFTEDEVQCVTEWIEALVAADQGE